jgi:hypothetical protein
MLNSQLLYNGRATRQQKQRRQRKKSSLDILNKDFHVTSSDDDSSVDIENEYSANAQDDAKCTQDNFITLDNSNPNTITYKPDDDDTYWDDNEPELSSDSSLPLYKNSHVTVKDTAKAIMAMATEFNFPKSAVERILKVSKSILPTPNLLPTTHTAIIKKIGVVPSSSSKFYCNSCLQLCAIRSGQNFCVNDKCKLMNHSLRNRNISEVVTMDIKEQLKSIITRNISLFGNENLSEPFDINAGTYYKNSMALTNRWCTHSPLNEIFYVALFSFNS